MDPEPCATKKIPPVSGRAERNGAKPAPRPQVSIAKLIAIFICFLMYTACVIVATMRYCELRNGVAPAPAAPSKSIIRYQKLDGTVLFMTPEEFNEFKKTEQPSRPPENDPFPAARALRASPPDPAPREAVERPSAPNPKESREPSGKTAEIPPATVKKQPEPHPATTTVTEVREEPPPPPKSPDLAKRLPTPPPPVEKTAPPPAPLATPAKTQPFTEPLDPSLQAKILRTKIQVYGSDVERLEKNLELVPESPESVDIREKLKRRLDTARKNLQDAKTQLEKLEQ